MVYVSRRNWSTFGEKHIFDDLRVSSSNNGETAANSAFPDTFKTYTENIVMQL